MPPFTHRLVPTPFSCRVQPKRHPLSVVTFTLCSALCLTASSATQPAHAQSAPPPALVAPVLAPLSEVQTLLDQGKAAIDARKYDEAEKLYRQALALAQSHADKVGENRALRAIGNVYRATGRNAEALQNYQQALVIARAIGDKEDEAFALINSSFVYGNTGRLAEALANFQQATALYRAMGDKSGEADTLLNMGVAYDITNRPAEALAAYQQAVALFHSVGDKKREADALGIVGIFYTAANRPAEALTTYQQATALYHAINDKKSEAFTLLNLGCIYNDTGRTTEALPNFQQAVALYHAIGDKSGEGLALLNLGVVYNTMGRNAEALAHFQQVLVIARSTGDKGDEAGVLNNLGSIYNDTGRPAEALANFQQALPLYHAMGDKNGEADMLNNLGSVYSATGRPAEALAKFQQALALFRSTGDKSREAFALLNIGVVYNATGRPAEALANFQQVLVIARSIGDKRSEAGALSSIGDVHSSTGRPTEALTTYHQALPLYHAIGDKKREANTLFQKAKAERKLQQRGAAKADYAGGIDLIEQIRANLGGYANAKQTYTASARTMYSDYLDFLLTAPRASPSALPRAATTAAFTLAQQTKGRSLLDLLDSGQVDLTGSLTNAEKSQLQTLRQQSDALNARLVKEGVENEVGAKARFAALQQQQRETEGQLQRLTETLYAQHPGLAEKRAAKTATLSDMVSPLDADTALVEYVQTTPGHLAMFVVTKSGAGAKSACRVTVRYLSVPASLAADCAAFQSACADPRKDYKPLASRLYKTLIAPVASAIAGKKRLIICPDGPLWNIPFQALLAGSGKKASFLADLYEIDYAYSATGALAAHNLRQRQITSAAAGKAGRKDSLLIVANPAFGDAKRFGDLDDLPGQRPIDVPSRPIDVPSRPIDVPSRPIDVPSRPLDAPSRPIDAPSRPIDSPSRAIAKTLERAGGRIASLPGTQREANSLRRLFLQATTLTGGAAQEGAVKKDAPRYRFLHLATHGFCNDAAPMLSSLVLAQPNAAAKAAGDDGFLTARELFGIPLPQTEMVTLSACNTGRGDIQSGEGVVGLTWALFAAGCPTQVVSQWSVDDACTATLMTKFYTQIKAGKPKGQALHNAARAVARDGGASGPHRHPYYWAPFVLFGEWR